MPASMYPYKEILALTCIAPNFKRKCYQKKHNCEPFPLPVDFAVNK